MMRFTLLSAVVLLAVFASGECYVALSYAYVALGGYNRTNFAEI